MEKAKYMRDSSTVVQRFREAGLKITPQRLSIFNLMKDNRSHPSAEDVYRQVLEIHPSISFTTVYKTLQTLRDLGVVNELSIDPERAHYDPDISEHCHTFCRSCSEIRDVYPRSPLLVESLEMDLEGFNAQGVQVHFVGTCRECQ